MDQHYKKKRAVLEQYSALEFEKDRISLKIEDASGWEIKGKLGRRPVETGRRPNLIMYLRRSMMTSKFREITN